MSVLRPVPKSEEGSFCAKYIKAAIVLLKYWRYLLIYAIISYLFCEIN